MSGAPPRFNRWTTLATSLAAMFVLGAVYAYGVFLPVFMEAFGWERSTAALPQSVQLFVYALGMGLGGALQDRTSPALVAAGGGLVFGAGFTFASLASTLAGLAVTIGLVSGLGFGFLYVSAVTATLKAFPERRGLAAGVVVGAFGLGTFVWAPAAQGLLDSGFGWQRILLGYGLLSFFVLPLISLGIRAPGPGHQAPGRHPEASGFTLRQALASRHFWLVFAAYTLVTTAGLMWMAHYKALGLSLGLSPRGAAFLVSLTAVGSGLGRVTMGWASDRIGRFPSLLGATLLELALFLALGFGLPASGLYPLAALAGFAFGTWLALYGPTSTDLFGMRAAGAIYGLLYLSYGLGGLLGPMVGCLLADLAGGYRLAFFVMAGACALGALLFGAAALLEPPHFPHPPALEEEFPV